MRLIQHHYLTLSVFSDGNTICCIRLDSILHIPLESYDYVDLVDHICCICDFQYVSFWKSHVQDKDKLQHTEWYTVH